MKSSTPLSIVNLTKKYKDFTAVDSVNFSINEGEIFGLLGPNGAGKTSIISVITTLEEATSGKALVFGESDPLFIKSNIGLVPQELIHYGFFTVMEILKFHAGYFGIKKIDHSLLEKLDLISCKDKFVNELSGGMKRRLLIAKALLHKPKLLLLDEPTAGVDTELRSSLWELILSLKKEGISILLTTHYLEEAEKLCDRIAILNHGKIQVTDTTNNLLHAHSKKTIHFELTESINKIDHKYLKTQNETAISFTVPNPYTIKTLLKESLIPLDKVSDIHIREGNLEDVYENILSK